MSRKTTESYMAVFDFVEQKIMKLDPSSFMSDYEDGLRSAIRQYWPGVPIYGCWSHFKYAVKRNCNSLAPKKLFEKNGVAREIKRMLQNIPLLPEELIIDGFNEIKSYAQKKKLSKSLDPIFKYFENYWLKKQVNYIDLHLTCKCSLFHFKNYHFTSLLILPEKKLSEILIGSLIL